MRTILVLSAHNFNSGIELEYEGIECVQDDGEGIECVHTDSWTREH